MFKLKWGTLTKLRYYVICVECNFSFHQIKKYLNTCNENFSIGVTLSQSPRASPLITAFRSDSNEKLQYYYYYYHYLYTSSDIS